MSLFLVFISAYTNPIDCDFEKDSCSWSIEGFRRISYNQFNGTGGWNDHMHRNGKEWYLYFDATNESYETLKSKPTNMNGLQCLNFWYRFSGREESQIKVFVQDIGGGNDSAIWETSGRWDTGWLLATIEIDVQYSSMVTILIRGTTGRSQSQIGIDDIVINSASCLDCNFLDGLCRWEGNEWTVPTKFNYAVKECKSSIDQPMLSSTIEIYPGERCLSFKYQTKGFEREKIYIDIQFSHGKQWSLVWKDGWHPQFQGWKETRVDINLRNKSRIAIKFAHSNCSNATYYISSISLKKQSCTESKTTFTASPTTVNPSTISIVNVTEKITATSTITTIVTLTSNEIDTTATTSIAAKNVTSTYSANDGLVVGIVIGCLALTVTVLLIAVYQYRRRRATSPNANTFKNSTVSNGTFSGASRTITNNGETRHSTERLSETSETVPYIAQAEYSTKTQPRQSRTQQRFITGIISIYPCQGQLLNKDGNNVTNPVQTHNQYHQSADKEGTNSYDTVYNTYTTEFRDDTYDSTIIYPKTIPDTTYDHTNFKQNFDNTYDHAKSDTGPYM